jgi:hypothetical protein
VPLLLSLCGAALALGPAYALGRLLTRKHSVPAEIALGLGAAAYSFLVFVLLIAHALNWIALLILGSAIAAAAWAFRGPSAESGNLRIPRPAWIIFAAFGIWYLVNALAPETVADGVTYHLGLAREYVRLVGFPDRIAFYDLVPQGMEMLYTAAFAFGRHAAAKLVEFAFFIATVPLIFRVGRRLGASDLASTVAAVFYFCAPVAGITGSSSYNDAAGVFFLLAAFYLLLLDDSRYLLPAGALAGFCYAIKMPGAFAVAAALVWLAVQRRWKSALIFSVGAALTVSPWVLRALILTGNPVAPLMNGLFPNPYFHVATERELAEGLRSFGGIGALQVPWELAFGDHLTGTFGPLLFALPIGLLALRRREGRLLLAGAAILALPWLTNTGARFLMPATVFAALALGISLPRPAAWAAIVVQAVLCWPNVIDLWETRFSFRLHEFPVAAAVGAESEADYCRRHLPDFNVARMIEKATPPDARTLALLSVANAYLDRDVDVTWQSAEADQALDTLRLAAIYGTAAVFDWKATWDERILRAVRFQMPRSYDGEWDINEVLLLSGEDRLFNSPQWTLTGYPNRWEGPLAFDGNMATRWRTWTPVRAGMHLDVEFGSPQRLTGATLVTHTPVYNVPLEVYGQDVQGAWRLLTATPQAVPRPPQDLRLDAARALRRSGYRFVLAPTGADGNAPIGKAIVGHEAEWGMELAGYAGAYYLLRVK